MAFTKSKDFDNLNVPASKVFSRDNTIKESILTGKQEENKKPAATGSKSVNVPVNHAPKKEQKKYRSYYLKQSQINKLDKVARENGFKSANAFLGAWIDEL